MHVSDSHSISASRLSLALISALLPLVAFTATASADNYNPCPSGITTWTATGGGNWDTSSNWSNGQPSTNCSTVISSPVAVTLSTTTQHFGSDNGTGVYGLALSGGATLVVEGEASGNQGNWMNQTDLGIGLGGVSIAKGSTLDLEATGNSATTPNPGDASGGGAYMIMTNAGSTPFVNDGTINASTTDSRYGEDLWFGADMANAGAVNVTSGTLAFSGQSPGMLINNTGSFNVSAGAAVALNAGDGSSFTNTGSYADQGTTTLSGSMYWIQDGGSESGNPVNFTGGETLQDSAGAGGFEYTNCGFGGGGLIGTIPQGQTITVQGITLNCSGNVGQLSVLSLGNSAHPGPVVNNGTIVMNASGSGTTSGGGAQIQGSELDNHGTLNATVSDSNYATTLSVPLVNESGATVNLTGGKLNQSAGTPTTNLGTVKVGPGADWTVQGGSFTNSGTVAMGIAGAKSYGVFTMTVGGDFKAGGTLAPTLSGYKPKAGAELPLFVLGGGPVTGKFKAVSNGFRADYSKETASTNPYVGVIYGAAASGKRPSVSKISGGAGKITLKLACAKGKACEKFAIAATVGKTKVATRSGAIKPTKSTIVSLKLNSTGTKLLAKSHKLRVKVVVKAGGKTVKSETVTVTGPGHTK